jgi:hypothetical protein
MSCFDRNKRFNEQIEADESLVNRSSTAKCQQYLGKGEDRFQWFSFCSSCRLSAATIAAPTSDERV